MIVTWSVLHMATDHQIMSWPTEQLLKLDELDKHYEGEVIGTYKCWWSGVKLVVACTDGLIRKVKISNVKIKDHGNNNSKPTI